MAFQEREDGNACQFEFSGITRMLDGKINLSCKNPAIPKFQRTQNWGKAKLNFEESLTLMYPKLRKIYMNVARISTECYVENF